MTQKIRQTIRKTGEHKLRLADSFMLLAKEMDKTRNSTSGPQFSGTTSNIETEALSAIVTIEGQEHMKHPQTSPDDSVEEPKKS